MNRTRSISLFLVLSLAALTVFALPGTASAAPDYSSLLARTNNTAIVDAPVQPTFAIPGIFSLLLGDNTSATQLDVPSLNATATVSGLMLGPTMSWDAITLSQKQPAVTEAGTISGAQVTVQGPQTGYSGNMSAQFDLHPGPSLQATGSVAVVYDGVNKTAGVALQDTSVTVPTWPVGFALSGVNTQAGTMTVDSAQVGIPAIGATVTVNGLQTGSAGTSWDSMVVAQSPGAELKAGSVASLSDIKLSVPGAGSEQAATVSANFAFNAGEIAHLEGTAIGVKDRTGGPSGIALQDTFASIQIPGWGLQFEGINSVQGGVKVDNIAFAAEPIHLTAELTGVTIGAGGGMTFDEAQVTFMPGEDGQPAPGAFQMTMTKSDAGYVLTTTSLLPIAAR